MSGDTKDPRIRRVEELIGRWPDFPKKGIIFRDIFPLMKDPKVFHDCISVMNEYIDKHHGKIDTIVGLDSRGFIFGPLIALRLGVAFVPVRKSGKLPGPTLKVDYALEYGKDVFEIQKDAVSPGHRVVIVDDLIATGGTMNAAHKLLTDLKADVLDCVVLIELVDLKGREKVPGNVKSFIGYEGE